MIQQVYKRFHLRFFTRCTLCALLWGFAHPALARKDSGFLYEHPFDIAAGGASLTRASAEGMLFANPALLPYGGKFFRWLGLRTTFIAGKDSIDLARDLAQSTTKQGSAGDESSDEGSSSADQTSEFIDKAFNSPIHFGQINALSFLTSHGGICVFSRVEPDIFAEKTGDQGVPALNFASEAYVGGIASLATKTLWRWLSVGVSYKYILAAEPQASIHLTDTTAISNLSKDGGIAESQAAYNQGTGFDAGLLFFYQSHNFDLRLAVKADDIGSTQLQGDANPKEFPQVVSSGLGFTMHNSSSALHLSVDYRDLFTTTSDKLFKKVALGAKLTLLGYIGLAAGIYQGTLSYGTELDLILLRLSATAYTRELGESPGDRTRALYSFSISSGFDF